MFICVYQQIENLIFAPKISQRTMDINDAVAFLAVLAFTSLFGALGAFLALPVVASVQTIFRTYTKRYELVDSPLMDDPVPEKKSKLVEGAEAISEHLHNMPRAVQGSSAHVPISDEVRQLQEQAYNISRSEESLESNETVAIPKHVLDKTEHKPLQGLERENTSQESNEKSESGNERKNDESRVGRGRSQAAAGNRGSGRSADGSRTAGSGRVAIAGNG